MYGKKSRAEANLETAKSDLDKQQKQAREEYGTHEVAELRKMLEDRRVENENKRRDYQAELDRIENELTAVEQQFAAAENPLASDAPRT